MLTAMQQSLTETLSVRQEMWDTVIEPFMPIGDWSPRAPEIMRKDKSLVKELMKLQDRIARQHQRAEALRSGVSINMKPKLRSTYHTLTDCLKLFNASGVVESRASTRLGEIVKLLTYVSIFYLPLSFSTSLWSTTDQIRSLDTAIMFGVMIALGVITYTIVLNLNNLSRTAYRRYEAIKRPWIKKMSDESNNVWSSRAQRYKGFKMRRIDSSPSEMLLVWYIITWPLRRCLSPKRRYTAEEGEKNQKAVSESEESIVNDNTIHESWLKGHPPFPTSEECKWLFNQRRECFAS